MAITQFCSKKLIMKVTGFLSLIMFHVVITACVPTQSNNGIVEITDSELLKFQEQGVAIIDVRTPEELSEGKIPGAYHVQLAPDFVSKLQDRSKDDPIILYCRSGNRSTTASTLLIEAGFKKVYNYTGGMRDWLSKGNPVE